MKVTVQVLMWLGVAALLLGGGCRDTMPHSFVWIATGDQIPTHPKPVDGGYYKNWDPYAATIEVTPVEDVNPVGTQHIFIATVKDKNGKPLPNRRVEWMLSDGVGSIVEVDESGIRASRGYKVDNRFAVSHTNNCKHVLTRGNDDPSDDIQLGVGQTWCVITSPIEGTSNVVAYAPGIYDWSKHKAFVKKHWFDAAWIFPPEAVNTIGTPHTLTTKVMRSSDNRPLEGYEVTYKIVSGPEAVLDPGGGTSTTVKSDAQGMATATLRQVKPVEGVNEIQVDVVRPSRDKDTGSVHMAMGMTRKTWIGPKIGIAKSAPSSAIVGQNFDYSIMVNNPSKVATTNTMLTDKLPEGIAYVSSDPPAKVDGQNLSWSLGTVAAGGNASAKVTVKGTRTGKFTNSVKVVADYGLSAEATADTSITQPKVQITKSGPAEVLLCEPINYTFVVTNQGDAPATNVKMEDQLPDGLTTQQKATAITADFGTLAPGESKKVQYAVTATKTGTYNNTVTIKGDGGINVSADAKTVVRQPVLAVTVDAPQNRYLGREVMFTVTVTNNGDGVAKNTVLTNTLPGGCTFVNASDGAKPEGDKLNWNLGELAPQASKKVTFTVRPESVSTAESMASVTAMCSKASAKGATDVRGVAGILLTCVDELDPILVGTNDTYVITVTNQGTAKDTNIVIKCILPDEQQFVSATGPTKETVDGQIVTFAPIKSLDPKATVTYKVVIKAVKAGDVRFKAQLTSDQIKNTPAEKSESTNQYSD